MLIDIFYGKGTIRADIPDKNLTAVFRKEKMKAIPNPEEEILNSLRNPIQTPPLSEIARGCESVCIVVNDITRPVPNKTILPLIIAELREAGVPDSGIFFLNATGSHRPNTGVEIVELIGEELASEFRFENHDAFNVEQHIFIGKTHDGTEVNIDKRYMMSDLKILTGLIEPHFMAGYSGGRKALCPGLAGISTIHRIHSPRFIESDTTTNCMLLENILHMELLEIANMAGVDFITNVVMNEAREICGVFSGHYNAAHMEGVRFSMKHDCVPASEQVEIVITSSAGYPLDKTYYQAIKGMVGALNIVKTGGTIVIAAECSEGLGNETFMKCLNKFAETGDIKEYIDYLCVFDNFVPDQWQVEMLLRALKKVEIILVTNGLTDEELEVTSATHASSFHEALEICFKTHGPNAKIAVIPEGPYVIPSIGV